MSAGQIGTAGRGLPSPGRAAAAINSAIDELIPARVRAAPAASLTTFAPPEAP